MTLSQQARTEQRVADINTPIQREGTGEPRANRP
jgi:hypothetical protein